MIFELAVFHPDAVAIAQECNVSRIELCDNYQVGGITPSIDNFSLARKNFDGPIMVMIRPQAGAFVYYDKILNLMLEENIARKYIYKLFSHYIEKKKQKRNKSYSSK
jgi:copper homeostasis protein